MYIFGHSDSTSSISWLLESLRSSMYQSALGMNDTFSRSEGNAWLIIMVWSVPNFRQEIRQSYCRNDNVKYDLGERPTLFYQYMTLWRICFVYFIDYSTQKSPKIVLKCRFCWMLVYPYSNIRGPTIIQIETHLNQIAFWPVPNPTLINKVMIDIAGFL